MNHGPGQDLQHLFGTRPAPCPYLPDRTEVKLATPLTGPDPVARHDQLTRAGFRRNQDFAYRPACPGCEACVPVRVRTADYAPGRTLRRIERRNADLEGRVLPARATSEQYALFRRYLDMRHADGGMADMKAGDYAEMVENSPIPTGMVELRRDGVLVGACLTDWLGDGVSAVYSFYEPRLVRRSLGSYLIVWLIRYARREQLPFVYLGYWVRNSPKMDYKSRFRPLEGFTHHGWRDIEP